MPPITDRLKHAWNAFLERDGPKSEYTYQDYGLVSTIRPDRPRFSRGNERTIVTSVYNRLAMDCASVEIQHVRLDDNNRYIETINSGLNNCLTIEANKDQTGRAFKQDIFMSMFDEGVVAIVPIDTDMDPTKTGSFEINTMRTGKILEWYPDHVKVRVYNDRVGKTEEIVVPKKMVCIIENPLYAVMNEPNSTMQRLISKLKLLDVIDEQVGSGKLDLIIQLPYVVKTEARKKQAELRRAEVEEQLKNSKYGIAYTDGTEKITQLNRSLENNLMAQIEYLTALLYSQLGITKEVMEGTANEEEMLNYNNRTIEPLLSAVVDEIKRKFLTKTARTQKQSVQFFRDPFRLVPISKLADIADRFTRNEILSANEVRQIVGMKPAIGEAADELRNKNIAPVGEQDYANTQEVEETEEEADARRAETFDNIDSELDDLEALLNE